MKHIIKSSEPHEFAGWKALHPDATFNGLKHERDFPGAVNARHALRLALLAEQKGLCCYCERLINNGDFHIEHFRPKGQSEFAYLQLDYSNLLASCQRNRTGSSDESCGHKKEDVFSADLVSPLEEDCASHFSFDMAGHISGSDARGSESVRILNLNSALLNRSRKALIEYFEELTDEEYPAEVAQHLDPTAPQAGEYFSMIAFLHGKGWLH